MEQKPERDPFQKNIPRYVIIFSGLECKQSPNQITKPPFYNCQSNIGISDF